MDSFFFHPKVVHLPLALALLMPLVTGALLLAWWRDWLPKRAWAIAVGLQFVLVVSAFVAMRMGEVDEERVEEVVPERYIEDHEEAAEDFTWGALAVLVIMGSVGLVRPRPAALAVASVASLGTVVILGLGYRTGEAGGELVYEHGAARAYMDHGSPPLPRVTEE